MQESPGGLGKTATYIKPTSPQTAAQAKTYWSKQGGAQPSTGFSRNAQKRAILNGEPIKYLGISNGTADNLLELTQTDR
ncbi:MAG: hypothetical protein M0R33_18585 [Methylomonas sp.]|jgi:hypothetical protein|nr:hypothetical protein [Methylomonas sp.]